jgi:adenosylcobinamide-GDP ribazoletransferase
MKAADVGPAGQETSAASGNFASIRRVLMQIRLAAGFLTILPVMPAQAADEDSVASSLGWFPIVGFALGATLALEDWLLRPVPNPELRAALLVMSLVIVTGAVHLDGLADTGDALGAGRDRPRALEILRDSRIGSFGALALFFVLTLKILALSTIGGSARCFAIVFAPGFARWAMVAVSFQMDYLRAAGAGVPILGSGHGRSLAIASATVAIAIAIAASLKLLAVWIVAIIATALLRGFYARWLGGVTGDLIGAAGELVEAIVLIAMSV